MFHSCITYFFITSFLKKPSMYQIGGFPTTSKIQCQVHLSVMSYAHLTSETLNWRIPRGSSFSGIVISATSIPGLFTLGCPAPTDPLTSSTLVIFTRKLSASSGISSLEKNAYMKTRNNRKPLFKFTMIFINLKI